MRARAELMGTQPIWRLLYKFSGPAIISIIVSSTYNIVDAIFVASLGEAALSAIGIILPFTLILVGISGGTGVGVASLISRRLGADDYEGASKAAAQAVTLSLIIGGLVTVIGFVCMDPLLRVLGARDDVVYALASEYIVWMLATSALTTSIITVAATIRSQGAPLYASTGHIASSVINVALDPIFIFALNMGVQGAAIATVIARACVFVMFLVYFLRKKTVYRFKLRYFKPDIRQIGAIYRIGLPSIIGSLNFSASLMVMNWVAGGFGVTTLAATSAVLKIGSLFFVPIQGLGQGMMPLIGYNYGAGNRDRISETIRKALIAGLLWGAMCATLAHTIPEPLMRMFRSGDEFLRIGAIALAYYSINYVTVGTGTVMGSFFQGIGKAIPSLVLSVGGTLLIFIPLLIILPNYMGVSGLFAAAPVGSVITNIISAVWMSRVYKKLGISFWPKREKQAVPLVRKVEFEKPDGEPEEEG